MVSVPESEKVRKFYLNDYIVPAATAVTSSVDTNNSSKELALGPY